MAPFSPVAFCNLAYYILYTCCVVVGNMMLWESLRQADKALPAWYSSLLGSYLGAAFFLILD